MIRLTIPNDDSVALYHFGKSLISMAAAIDGAPDWVVITAQEYDRLKQLEELSQAQHIELNIDSSDIEQLREALKKVKPAGLIQTDVIVDTTAQQVESLATNVDLPEPQVSDAATDSTGTPWDERIHSTSKALNADGTWRLRRKPKDMDEEQWVAFVETVKGELHTQTPVMTDEEVKALESAEISEPTKEEVDELIEASNKMLEPPVTPPGDDFHTDTDVVTEQTVAGIPPLPVPQLGGGSHSSQSTPYKLVGSGDELSSGSGTGIPPLPVPPPVVVAPPVTEQWDFPRLMTFLTERHGKIDVATVNTLLAQDGMSSVQELNAHPDKIGPFVARVKAHLGE